MKTTPTDIDREAAILFSPAPGMRAFTCGAIYDGERGRVIAVPEGLCIALESLKIEMRDGTAPLMSIIAIDTNDPATVGCMLAQVEQAANHTLSEVADNGEDYRRPERRHVVMVWSARENCERHEAAHGPTRGAALVAAMRKFKNGATP